ncbi:tRNA (cytidine(34)-2'-O)-methyltransferase [Megalodesulfovibrio paquesii]
MPSYPASPFDLALFEPEIPPNTGNISRLCAATQTRLHLIEPLGFSIDDRQLKRAGLDYWPHVPLAVWPGWEAFRQIMQGRRLVGTSSRAGETHCTFAWQPGDVIVLGPETRGLPAEVQGGLGSMVRIPVYDTVRSLNLSTAAGILLYEALRQVAWMPGE